MPQANATLAGGLETTPEKRATVFAAARIRALYRPFNSRRFIIGFSTVGAVLVVIICYFLGNLNVERTAIWLAIVVAADIGLTMLDRGFQSAGPDDSEVERWGWARAGFAGLRGLAWSLGPIIMYTHKDMITLVVPVWGIINLVAASAYTAAPFFPCLIATIVAGIFPAAAWLALQDTDAARLGALLLVLALPFVIILGLLGRRNMEALIGSRLDVADLLERQKRQTEIVEATMQERTRFFSSASHDLRQPLQALGFYTSLLASAPADDTSREIVSRLADCVSSLERQFSAIMGIAESDVAVRRAKTAATPLHLVFERVAISVRPEAELKNLEIRIVPTRLWGMVAPELLERVLVNFAANAIRYTPAGAILMGARRRGDAAELWVTDTGIGIPDDDREKIFQEFYQVGNPARNREQGYGLGLAIVRRLCDGAGWPVECRSTLGRGSTFKVTVPIVRPSLDDQRVEIAAAQAQAAEPDLGVVIADDDPLVRDAMKRLIESWGAHVETCRSGDEIMEILGKRNGALRWHALIDFRLSGGEDGLIVADRVRDAFGDKVGVILITAETDAAIFEQAALRAIATLRKPVKPIRLRAILTAPREGHLEKA